MVYGLHSNNIFYHNKNSVEQIVKCLLKKVDFSSFINQNLCSCALAILKRRQSLQVLKNNI